MYSSMALNSGGTFTLDFTLAESDEARTPGPPQDRRHCVGMRAHAHASLRELNR